MAKVIAGVGGSSRGAPAAAVDGQDLKRSYALVARTLMQAFLRGGGRLKLPVFRQPEVSILIPLWNRAELTLASLGAIQALRGTPYELILVDNASQDETPELLKRIDGARIVVNAENRGFGGAMNQAARLAVGKYLLFLNNDLQVVGDSVCQARGFLDAHQDVGAVGGKIVLLDGTLQEAGCSINPKGFPDGLGRGESPDDGRFAEVRDVDYCSAALLMTRRTTFEQAGGFDPSFHPGYYEDVDYCATLWKRGARVVCHPGVQGVHYESASLPQTEIAALCRRNRERFVAKHRDWLLTKPRH